MYYEPWMSFKCYHCSIPTCCADLNNYPMDLRWPTNSYVGFRGNTPASILHQADGGHYCFPESIKGNEFIKNNPMPTSARPHIYFNHFCIWALDLIELYSRVAAKEGMRRTMFDCCLDLMKFVS